MTEGLQAGAYFMERDGAKTVALLNEAIEIDRNSLATLLRTRVLVGNELAEKSGLLVGSTGDSPSLSVIGLLNSVLRANGLPMITVRYSNDGTGEMRLDGVMGFHPVRG